MRPVRQVEVRQAVAFSIWFEALADKKASDRIAVRIRRLELGNPSEVKPVGDGISEMKIDYGPGYRVYFMKHGTNVVILLCGGDKSSQARDIKRAKQLAKGL